jgi:hypothetical protein
MGSLILWCQSVSKFLQVGFEEWVSWMEGLVRLMEVVHEEGRFGGWNFERQRLFAVFGHELVSRFPAGTP